MRSTILAAVLFVAILFAPAAAQQDAAVQPARFAGTWVGTQAWAIKDPPPGASKDQAVTLDLQVVDGKVTGTMKPFLGGEDGATIVDASIVGDELRATAVVGRPRTPTAGRGRGGAGGFKDATRIAFVFRVDGVKMTGSADVQMGDVPWMKFSYDLGKKRSRY
jgi:opacity protein-like surface antigen